MIPNDIHQCNHLHCTQPDVTVIMHIEATVNGRLIYPTYRKLFYTIYHHCITNIHYHRRQAWTRLNNHIRGRYRYNRYHHFRTSADWYLDKRKQLYFVCHLSRVSSATYHKNCRYNRSTTFKLMSYEMLISQISFRSLPIDGTIWVSYYKSILYL